MRRWQRERDPASERLSGGVENEVAQAGAVLRQSDGPTANAGHGGLFRKGRDPPPAGGREVTGSRRPASTATERTSPYGNAVQSGLFREGATPPRLDERR
jgi:hypothetical protein